MEEWKTINDYPNYSISSLGVIKNNKNLIMKLSPKNDGYLIICLSKDGIQKNFRHHQLIGIHFIPNPENFSQIDHINGVRNDNRLENLRWGNQSQNCRNRKKKNNTSSKYFGVCYYKRDNKFQATININGEKKYLGSFTTGLEAFNAWKGFVIQNNLQEFYSQVEF